MAKINLSSVSNIGGNPNSAATNINNNSDALETAFLNTLSRDGSSPNQMEADFDVNHNDILNANETHTSKLFLNGSEISSLTDLTNAYAVTLTENKFTGDGTSTAFALSSKPGVDQNAFVWVGGAIQDINEYSVNDFTLTFSEAPYSGADVRVVVISTVTYNEVAAARDEAVAAAAEAAGAASLAGVSLVSVTSELDNLDYTKIDLVFDLSTGFSWVWKSGNLSTQVTNDPQKNYTRKSSLVSASLGAWVRYFSIYATNIQDRVFHFADYAGRYLDDQGAFEALVKDAYTYCSSTTSGIAIDLDGMMVTLTRPVNFMSVTGQSGNQGIIQTVNGSLVAAASTDWDETTVTKTLTWTANSNVMTMASTSGITLGMYIDTAENISNGIPRQTFVTEITDGTSIVVNTYAWKSGSGSRTLRDFKFMLDFTGMNCSHKSFKNLSIHCNGIASGIKCPSTALNLVFSDLNIRSVKNVMILDWRDAGGGMIGKFIEGRPDNPDPATRTAMGIVLSSGDCKFLNNRIINFQHSMVVHAAGLIIHGCHNFQGASGTTATRSAGFLFTKEALFISMVGNYIDNGGVEWTTENQSSSPSGMRQLTLTGNIFTFNDGAQSGSYMFKLYPILTGGGTVNLSGVIVQGNVFRKLGSSLDSPDNVNTNYGSLNPDGIVKFTWDDNGYAGFTKQTTTRPRIIFNQSKANINTGWNLGTGSDWFPFGLHTLNIESFVPGGTVGLLNSSDAQTSPGYATRVDSTSPWNIRVRFSEAVYGQVSVIPSCSLPT